MAMMWDVFRRHAGHIHGRTLRSLKLISVVGKVAVITILARTACEEIFAHDGLDLGGI